MSTTPLKRLVSCERQASAGGVPYVGLEHVESGTGKLLVDWIPHSMESPSGLDFRPNDVLFGKLRPYLAKSFLAQFQGCCSSEFLVLRPKSALESRFLSYVVQSRPFVEWANTTTDGAKMPRSDWDAIRAFETWLTSPERQVAIADYLDSETSRIDRLIANRTAAVRLLLERFLSAIFSEVSGSSVPGQREDSGLEWLGSTPRSWQTRKTAWDYEVQLGKMLNQGATDGPEPRPYLRNSNVQWDHVTLDDVAEMSFDADDRIRFALRPGDLLVCEGGEVGRAAIWNGRLGECYYQKALHRVRPRHGGNPRFLMYCLRAASSRGVFTNEGNQSTIVHLTAEKLQEHRFPFPPPQEQARVVRTLDSHKRRLDTATALIHRQIQLLHERRQALITAAITGQVPIPGAT
jgi:type I restriction enzyme, S subunit